MEITWHGKTCFTIKNDDASVIINPHHEISLSGSVVLMSLPENATENAKGNGAEKIFNSPGEYEIKGIPIVAIPAWKKEAAEESELAEEDMTIIYFFDVDGMRICHLGELGHKLTSDMLKSIGDVDILMINGDKNSPLGLKRTEEMIEAIEPRSIAIMGEEFPSPLLNELGAGDLPEIDKLVLKNRSALPEDKREYYVFKKV